MHGWQLLCWQQGCVDGWSAQRPDYGISPDLTEFGGKYCLRYSREYMQFTNQLMKWDNI